jgi:acetyl esterase/lipase
MKLLGPLLYGGEDCLQLSVYAAAADAAAPPRPVFFFIYGGAFILGDDEELGWYDGEALSRALCAKLALSDLPAAVSTHSLLSLELK